MAESVERAELSRRAPEGLSGLVADRLGDRGDGEATPVVGALDRVEESVEREAALGWEE